MKITKKRILSFIILSALLPIQFILIYNVNIVQAGDLWETVQKGGLDKIGTEAYDQGDDPIDIRTITVNIIKIALTFLGIIFMVLIMWAGYTWMISRGNEEKVKEARSRIITAIIGLIIILSAWAITSFISDCIFDITEDATWMCK